MAKPTTYIPDIKDQASVDFNKRLNELRNVKESVEVKERIFDLVEKVLAKS